MHAHKVALGAALIVVVLTNACGIVSIRPYVSKLSVSNAGTGLSLFTVAVVSGQPHEVERTVNMLRTASVFRNVVAGPLATADLDVTVLESQHGIKCGTPQMLTWLTLGLVPTGNGYRGHLKLSFRGTRSPDSVVVERTIFAETRHGLWALPLRASRNWRKPNWEGDAAGLSAALREELLAHQAELIALARRKAA